MCTYHQARYFHYKPPYPVSGYCYCGNGRNKDSISISMKVPMQGATIKKEEPQSALVIPCPDAAPAPSALQNESRPDMSAAIPGPAAQSRPNPVDGRRPLREDSPAEAPNITDIEGPRSAPVILCHESAHEPSTLLNKGSPEINAAIQASTQAPLNPADGQCLLHGDFHGPNRVESGTSNVLPANLDEQAHPFQDARSGGAPAMSKTDPSPEPTEGGLLYCSP